MAKGSSLWNRILLLALGGLAGLVVMEVGLKVIAATPLWRALPVIEPILGAPDYNIGYGFTPHVSGIWVRENRAPLTITDLGLRGPAGIEVEKQPGDLRIAVTGDSNVEALQVEYEYTFTALIQDMLNRGTSLPAPVKRVQVLNLAMSGNGPLRQLVRLEHFGYPLKPDIVLSITNASDFLTNEMYDDRLNPGYVPDGAGRLVRGYAYRNRLSMRYVDSVPGRAFLAMLRYSEVARLLYLRSKDSMLDILGLASAARPGVKTADKDICYQEILAPLHRLWVDHMPEDKWRGTGQLFDEFEAGIRQQRVTALYGMRNIPLPPPQCAGQQAMRAAILAAMEADLGRRGIILIDIERVLAARIGSEASDKVRLLRGFGRERGEGHLNYEGHKVYAAVLSELLAHSIRQHFQASR